MSKPVLQIQKLMSEQGLTYRKLGTNIGMSYTSIANIANGKTNASVDTLERIAEGLNVHVRDLFTPPSIQEVECPKCGEKFYIISQKEYDRLNKK